MCEELVGYECLLTYNPDILRSLCMAYNQAEDVLEERLRGFAGGIGGYPLYPIGDEVWRDLSVSIYRRQRSMCRQDPLDITIPRARALGYREDCHPH